MRRLPTPAALLLAALTALASAPLANAAQNHLLIGTQENPVFVNSSVGTDLLWGAGYYGQGIVIANVEGGHVWPNHEVFDRAAISTALGITLPPSPAVTVNIPVSASAPEIGEVDYHATMVGHVLVGATTVTNGDGSVSLTQLGAGMAPLATLWSGAIATHFDKTIENAGSFEISPESFRLPYVEFFTGATHGRADVINSSWGSDDASATSDETRTITGLAAQNPQVTAVFSAGNSGPGLDKIGGPGSSFNVITVGSVGGADGLTPSSFSSGGLVSFYNPATLQTIAAARAAVHIAAPGENFSLAAYLGPSGGLEPVLPQLISQLPPGATADDGNLYFIFSASGTSFAAPTVAGGVGLLKNVIKTIEIIPGSGILLLPQTTALDARVMRSVIMATATRTTGWNNGQALAPNGELVTTQSVDLDTGAGRFDVAQAALLYVGQTAVPGVFGTIDVPGLGGGTELAPSGWDFGAISAISVGTVNDYTLDLGGLPATFELAVSLNWFVDDHFDALTGAVSYGSFANLDLEVWSLTSGGAFDVRLASSQSLYNNTEFLRFILSPTSHIGLRVRFNGVIYDFDNLVGSGASIGYGLAWTATAIPEPSAAAIWAGASGLLFVTLRRRRRRA